MINPMTVSISAGSTSIMSSYKLQDLEHTLKAICIHVHM